jgi:ribosomal protein S26
MKLCCICRQNRHERFKTCNDCRGIVPRAKAMEETMVGKIVGELLWELLQRAKQ